jgi:hypothetical protein
MDAIDVKELILANQQARSICDAVAKALGDDLNHEEGSAVSILFLKERLTKRIAELEAAAAEKAKSVVPVGYWIHPTTLRKNVEPSGKSRIITATQADNYPNSFWSLGDPVFCLPSAV